MASIGFITIGIPNIKGSLILNIPGIIENLPTFRKYSDFEKIINMHNPKVAPAPPIHINHWKNGSGAICGSGLPAAAADTFASNNTNHIGLTKDPITDIPCIPAVHKIVINNTGTKTPPTVAPQVKHRFKNFEEQAKPFNIPIEMVVPMGYTPIGASKVLEQIKKHSK